MRTSLSAICGFLCVATVVASGASDAERNKNLIVENIAISRTNGAPAPNSRIAAAKGTAFGSLKISNVTLDGVAIDSNNL